MRTGGLCGWRQSVSVCVFLLGMTSCSFVGIANKCHEAAQSGNLETVQYVMSNTRGLCYIEDNAGRTMQEVAEASKHLNAQVEANHAQWRESLKRIQKNFLSADERIRQLDQIIERLLNGSEIQSLKNQKMSLMAEIELD